MVVAVWASGMPNAKGNSARHKNRLSYSSKLCLKHRAHSGGSLRAPHTKSEPTGRAHGEGGGCMTFGMQRGSVAAGSTPEIGGSGWEPRGSGAASIALGNRSSASWAAGATLR